MSKNLILFTIGPVQSFIAQARKTQDLYAGSRLLSDLIKKAIETVGEKHLIFPKMGKAMPNRFLAEVPENIDDLNDFGQKVKKAVCKEWREIAQKSLIGVQKPDGFDQQIESHLEIFWVIEPQESDYKTTLEKLEKQLAAIKNIRAFSQYNWQEGVAGERGRKCSLDGQRNVQFYRPKDERRVNVTDSPLYSTENGVQAQQFSSDILQPGEGLSAVSFVKRKYEKKGAFDSTAEIALLDALNFLIDRKKNIESCIRMQEYKNAFQPFNAQLFYEEGLSKDFLIKQGISYDRPLEELQKIRKVCLEDFAKENGFKFQKYYAVLTFDGDDMGKWLSGEKLTNQSKLRAFQEKLAECLAKFASEAQERLNSGSGQTVYAGGDDFLGFVNLNHLLPVLADLRRLFSDRVDTQLAEFKTGKITFSAGICVAHYKEPLSLVLQEAKNAQKVAKTGSKDAFAISVIKGSGETNTTSLPFLDNAANVERLKSLTHALINEDFSNNFIKTMRLEMERVMDFEKDRGGFEDMFKTELIRLLQRAAKKSWSREEKKDASKECADELMEMFGMGDKATENFFQMLHIADFFKREIDPKSIISEPQTTT